MKIKLLEQILLSSFVLSSFAAVPSEINYQGLITDSDGDPIASASNSVAVNLYQVETGGTAIYTQSFTQVASDANGIYSIQIGGASLQSVLEANNELWLELIINEETLSPRQEINSVPYALVAKSAESFAPGSAASNAITALQTDVAQNESDADIAIAALQTENTNRVSTDASLQADLNAEAASRTAADATLQADIDQNESDADAAIADLEAENALRSEKEPVAYIYDTNQNMSSLYYQYGSDVRILLAGQTDLSQNGIYTWQQDNSQGPEVAYSLVRTQDFDEASEMQAGAFVFVTSGDSSGKGYILTQSVYTLDQYSHIHFKRFTYDQELDAFDTSTLSSKAPVQAVKETNIVLSTSYSYGADKRFNEYNNPYETGDRILFMGQDSAKENGIYEVINQSFADVYLSRSQDLNAQNEFFGGIFVFVEKGPLAGQGYILEALHDDFQLDAFSNHYGYHDINFSKFTIDTASDINLSGNLTVTGSRADFSSAQEVIVPTPDEDNEATSKAYVDAAVAANTSALAAETSARATAITALQTGVDQNESDADAAIAAEASTARAAEQANADNIFSNTTDISNNAVNINNHSSDIGANTSAIAAEITNRLSADTALQSDINQNESDADAAIAALQSEVDQNEVSTGAAIASLQDSESKMLLRSAVQFAENYDTYIDDEFVDGESTAYLTVTGYGQSPSYAEGDRLLLAAQDNARENGVYEIWEMNGSRCYIRRAQDFNESEEFKTGVFLFVEKGSNGGHGYVILELDSDFELDSTYNGDITYRRFTLDTSRSVTFEQGLSAQSVIADYGSFGSGISIPAPTFHNEATNKAYVDSVVVPSGGLIAWPVANDMPDGWSAIGEDAPVLNYIWIRKD